MNSIIDYLESWSERQPETCLSSFLDLSGREVARHTYRSFANATRNLAGHLSRRAGLRFGDRVLLVYPPGLEVTVAFVACARLGALPVPVCPPAGTSAEAAWARVAFAARDCGAAFALTTSAYLTSWHAPAPAFVKWIATDEADIAGRAPRFHDEPNRLLFLQYTSGSTSDPKGVMVSHENVIHNALAMSDHTPIGVCWLPHYHDMGLIGYHLFPLIAGGTTYSIAPMDFLRRPLLWLQTLSRFRATCASSPNFGFEYCLREDRIPVHRLRELDLSSVRVLMSAAEPARASTFEAFVARFSACGLRPDAHVVAYGLAEATLGATHYGRRILTVDQPSLLRNNLRVSTAGQTAQQMRLVSCGRPLEGVRVRIAEPATGAALGDGRVGEIWLSGKSVCQGYWNRPDLNREVFRRRISNDPADDWLYLRTGDLGFFHEGELFVCGRIKDLLIIQGVNYYAQDIERAVESASAQIRAGGVAAFRGDGEIETLVILIETRDPLALPPPAEIARTVRAQCGIAPHRIAFVPPRTVRRTTSGKIMRSLTRRQYLAGKLPVIAVHTFDAEPASGSAGAEGRFRSLLAQYHLSGRETASLGELGIDSLTLVDLLLDLKQMLVNRGALDLVSSFDTQLIQQLTVTELFALVDGVEHGSHRAFGKARRLLHRRQREYETRIQARMRADAVLEMEKIVGTAPERRASRTVLLTGPTGFFGPFLLDSLLRQTSCSYIVLTRAASPADGFRRVREGLERAHLWSPAVAAALQERVRVICGDISRRNLGLGSKEWSSLAAEVDAIFHNAAMVNYVAPYEALSPHNVTGTRELLRFACSGRAKEFHHVSSTFIFGWSARGVLMETDNNDGMSCLDFGYAQTKWVAEQLVFAAGRLGLPVRIYRPSLISASMHGVWESDDIAVRLLAFMINHRIAVHTQNQLSFLPADVVADNLTAIFARQPPGVPALHATADSYYSMVDVTRLITSEYGYEFSYYEIPDFITELNRRCTADDLLYPLLDFFNRSHEKIAAMQLKRYNNDRYRAARDGSVGSRSDPPLQTIVGCMVEHMLQQRLIPPPPIAIAVDKRKTA